MNIVPFKKERSGKKFSWSYSRLKNFEVCPKRYHEVDVLKNFSDASEHSDWGEAVHAAFAARLSRKKPLPVTMERYEWEIARLERIPGKIRTELKLSFDNQFRATGFFDGATWFRAVIDVLIIDGDKARIADWKTGKHKDDYAQLATQAQAVFANHPEVEEIGAEFVWLGDPTTYTQRGFTRRSMIQEWNALYPRLQLLQQAHATEVFPAQESGLCRRYCPVETCKFNGRNR